MIGFLLCIGVFNFMVPISASAASLSPGADYIIRDAQKKNKMECAKSSSTQPPNQTLTSSLSSTQTSSTIPTPQPTHTPSPTPSPIPTPSSTPTPSPTPTPTPMPVEIPQELLEFSKNYPETADYVNAYPEKYQLHPEIDLSEEAAQDTVPLFIQWDERWGYEPYGASFIGCSGCGPTSFSMAAVYLTHDPQYSPLYMAKYADENGYHINGVGTSWSFFTKGCEAFGIRCTTLSLKEETIKEYLDKGCPIICSVGPGDFTVRGHLIVIAGYDEKGLIINDPNSRKNSEKRWDFNSIKSQIRSVWAFSLQQS